MSTCNNLPPEIIEDILRRLPAKSLGRFRCVSKPWCSLISNPQFIKTHLHHNHHHDSKLIVLSDKYILYSVDINKLPPYLDTQNISVTGKQLSFRPSSIIWDVILGSCNGVVLARDEDDKIYLINPTTRELWEIPVSPFALPIEESYDIYGFGYDSSTNDYKVVSISFLETEDVNTDMFVSIYSLRYNSWRKLQNSPFDHYDVGISTRVLTSGVLINENLHWLTHKRPGYSWTIVAFSFANEEFKEIKFLDDRNLPYRKLGALLGVRKYAE